jgi:4-diphosphocytidyl-2-C-methyl-D-erythritol kinase
MRKIILKAPAKLNLFLNIVGKRDDGYHLLESIMQTIDLFDIVTVEEREDRDICISCDNKFNFAGAFNIIFLINLSPKIL